MSIIWGHIPNSFSLENSFQCRLSLSSDVCAFSSPAFQNVLCSSRGRRTIADKLSLITVVMSATSIPRQSENDNKNKNNNDYVDER